jgi:hypothetical protein
MRLQQLFHYYSLLLLWKAQFCDDAQLKVSLVYSTCILQVFYNQSVLPNWNMLPYWAIFFFWDCPWHKSNLKQYPVKDLSIIFSDHTSEYNAENYSKSNAVVIKSRFFKFINFILYFPANFRVKILKKGLSSR